MTLIGARMKPPSVTPRGDRVATVLLVALILSIGLSPRIRLGEIGGQPVDLRVQEILLIPSIVYTSVVSHGPFRKMRAIWGNWMLLFVAGLSAVTFLHILFWPSAAFLELAFFARTLESIAMAGIAASLYLTIGSGAPRIVLRAFRAIVVLNGLWVVLQLVTGVSSTLIGDVYESSVYGPRLVGEPSVFGAGAFFAWAAVLGAAEFRHRLHRRRWAWPILLISFVGALTVQSRVSLVVVLGVGAVLALRSAYDRGWDLPRMVFAIATAGSVLVVLNPQILSRLTASDVVASTVVRSTNIWGPVIDAVIANPLVGIGAGRMGSIEYPWDEAHNVFLRSGLEYGLPVAVLYFAGLSVLIVRSIRLGGGQNLPQDGSVLLGIAGAYGVVLLAMGMLQDALTPVMSTHLLMISAGIACGELHRGGRVRAAYSATVDVGIRV